MVLKKIHTLFTAGISALSLTGCATVINGSQQVIKVETPHAINATCELSNSRGSWELKSTPGRIKINRDSEKLDVLCHKKNYADGTLQVSSLYNTGNMGNLIFGGVIGMVVDETSKATYS
jgi:hypothetical protein